jgi:hypothetical protein
MTAADWIIFALSAVSLLWSLHTWRQIRKTDQELRAKWRREDSERYR